MEEARLAEARPGGSHRHLVRVRVRVAGRAIARVLGRGLGLGLGLGVRVSVRGSGLEVSHRHRLSHACKAAAHVNDGGVPRLVA